MKRFLGFFSLSMVTQFLLAGNQLLLLPLQIRVWGLSLTGHWLYAVAICNLLSIADLGLRNCAHDDLLQAADGDQASSSQFPIIWALTRLTFGSVTCLVFAIFASIEFHKTGKVELWALILFLASASDAVYIIRGVWLDTVGAYIEVEFFFLLTLGSRLLLAVFSLYFLHASPLWFASIMLATSIFGLIAQERIKCFPKLLSFVAPGGKRLRLHHLIVIRLAVADPLSGWTRTNLPVIALTSIATPLFVTTFVALRAIFGLVRQVTGQLARYGSVRFIQIRHDVPFSIRLIARLLLVCAVLNLAVSILMIADNARLIKVWLGHADASVDFIILSFAIGSTGISHLLMSSMLIRLGDIWAVAWRQYIYILLCLVSIIAALASKSTTIYLFLLAQQDLIVACIFANSAGPIIERVFYRNCSISLILILCVFASVQHFNPLFGSISPASYAWSLVLGLGTAAFAAALCAVANFQAVWRPEPR